MKKAQAFIRRWLPVIILLVLCAISAKNTFFPSRIEIGVGYGLMTFWMELPKAKGGYGPLDIEGGTFEFEPFPASCHYWETSEGWMFNVWCRGGVIKIKEADQASG